MARFIGIDNGYKALAHLLSLPTEDMTRLVMGWDANETDDGLTQPEAETQMRLDCNAPEVDDVNYCTCGRHQWDANALNGWGDVVPCSPTAPWRVERR